MFPCNLLPSTYYDSDNGNALRARTELERRKPYMDTITAHIGALHPALVQLVEHCLDNLPDQRPSTEELLTRLQGMRVEVEGEYGSGAIRLDLTRVKMAKEVIAKDARIEELEQKVGINKGWRALK